MILGEHALCVCAHFIVFDLTELATRFLFQSHSTSVEDDSSAIFLSTGSSFVTASAYVCYDFASMRGV